MSAAAPLKGLDEAVSHAREALPEGWSLHLEVSRGAGILAITSRDGDIYQIGGESPMPSPEHIRGAVAMAQELAAKPASASPSFA